MLLPCRPPSPVQSLSTEKALRYTTSLLVQRTSRGFDKVPMGDQDDLDLSIRRVEKKMMGIFQIAPIIQPMKSFRRA